LNAFPFWNSVNVRSSYKEEDCKVFKARLDEIGKMLSGLMNF